MPKMPSSHEGKCQLCGKWIALRADARVRQHGKREAGDAPCPGSLSSPSEKRLK